MSYSTNYTDENGHTKEVSITQEDSVEALKNDYQEIVRKYDPRYVSIQRVQTKPGEAMHLVVRVNAPSHYLTAPDDTSPKPCSSMSVNILVFPGYPLTKIQASYDPNRYLASPNVFRNGHACIDDWVPFTSSLTTVVDKLVHDMIHDSLVTNYKSMANPYMEQWHKEGVAQGRFPTIAPQLLYLPERTPLPPRKTTSKPVAAPPPLPPKRR